MKMSRPLIFLARGLFVLALTLAFDTSETQVYILSASSGPP